MIVSYIKRPLITTVRFQVPNQAILLEAISGGESYNLDDVLQPLLGDHLSPYPSKIEKLPVHHPDREEECAFFVCLADCPDLPSMKDTAEDFLRYVLNCLWIGQNKMVNCKMLKFSYFRIMLPKSSQRECVLDSLVGFSSRLSVCDRSAGGRSNVKRF